MISYDIWEKLPTPVFWPGEFHGLCSPWGSKESDTTERLSLQWWYDIVTFSNLLSLPLLCLSGQPILQGEQSCPGTLNYSLPLTDTQCHGILITGSLCISFIRDSWGQQRYSKVAGWGKRSNQRYTASVHSWFPALLSQQTSRRGLEEGSQFYTSFKY